MHVTEHFKLVSRFKVRAFPKKLELRGR